MEKLVINEMFAFVSESAEGEGVIGFNSGEMGWVPMVGADMARIKSLIPMAEHIRKESGVDYKILKFSTREDITEQIKK